MRSADKPSRQSENNLITAARTTRPAYAERPQAYWDRSLYKHHRARVGYVLQSALLINF